MRHIAMALIVALAACDASSGEVEGARRFRQVPGLEGQYIGHLAVAGDGTLYLTRGLKDPVLMTWDGARYETCALPGEPTRVTVDPEGVVHVVVADTVYRMVDGVAEQVGPSIGDGFIDWVAFDGRGGTYAGHFDGPYYLAPGGNTWVDVAPGLTMSYGGQPARDAMGNLYTWAHMPDWQGVVRMPPEGGPLQKAFECDRVEFGFCASGAAFVGNGKHPVYAAVGNAFQEGGGTLYRLDGTDLVHVAKGPKGEGHWGGQLMAADGRVYLMASKDNGNTERKLYRLNGGAWEVFAVLPGASGAVAFGPGGQVFATQDMVFHSGGLWELVR